MTALFACEGITKSFAGEIVVENVSLTLPEDGFISLVGPSGAGKTTLFNILAGVENPDAGRVLLFGEDITGSVGRVSYMLQKDLLLEYRSALDNVILPLLIRGENKKTARAYGASFFPRFGLAGSEYKYPHQMSGGMRQRAALLRTYFASQGCGISMPSPGTASKNSGDVFPRRNKAGAAVILLDEPFSALDALTRRDMQNWYAEIASEMHFATLFITHDVDEAVSLSDVVYILKGKPGKITGEIPVPVLRPRRKDFPVSEDALKAKREIVAAL